MRRKKSWCDDCAKARKEWEKENGYYTSEYSCWCIDCIYFSIDHEHPTIGKCNRIKQAFQAQEFVKMGVTDEHVSMRGFCENYTNTLGIGVDGKVMMPQLLPTYIKTKIDKTTNQLFIK
jgi:hypothetical protein